jgi:hypothetical protein
MLAFSAGFSHSLGQLRTQLEFPSAASDLYSRPSETWDSSPHGELIERPLHTVSAARRSISQNDAMAPIE